MCFGVLGGAMIIFDEDQTTIRFAKIKPDLGLFELFSKRSSTRKHEANPE
jgi:hypothetical protein